MWPFDDRRRYKRHAVRWEGSLRCVFSNCEETIPIDVVEVSMSGARLLMHRMQVGQHHLLISDQSPDVDLDMSVPGGAVTASIALRWYNYDEENRRFAVGIEFIELDTESQATLKEAIKELR